ncbi:hypothetical protein BJ508DRAFT_346630 [Ascobolus immersus RN42]|uniref:Uncharacterized protein n=1 Tax=Ascobolus immersus RN42 TaxID=1160509 RepID=A0A3N4ILX1_ASCIM|nr:hypothetical protein BJ508DRAFT_346630 [Ascobolus immersus RN42]
MLSELGLAKLFPSILVYAFQYLASSNGTPAVRPTPPPSDQIGVLGFLNPQNGQFIEVKPWEWIYDNKTTLAVNFTEIALRTDIPESSWLSAGVIEIEIPDSAETFENAISVIDEAHGAEGAEGAEGELSNSEMFKKVFNYIAGLYPFRNAASHPTILRDHPNKPAFFSGKLQYTAPVPSTLGLHVGLGVPVAHDPYGLSKDSIFMSVAKTIPCYAFYLFTDNPFCFDFKKDMVVYQYVQTTRLVMPVILVLNFHGKKAKDLVNYADQRLAEALNNFLRRLELRMSEIYKVQLAEMAREETRLDEIQRRREWRWAARQWEHQQEHQLETARRLAEEARRAALSREVLDRQFTEYLASGASGSGAGSASSTGPDVASGMGAGGTSGAGSDAASGMGAGGTSGAGPDVASGGAGASSGPPPGHTGPWYVRQEIEIEDITGTEWDV